uniref:CID domain-containing protein n=1 Tax=Schistosoma japonicum TaxID=6182 RepID=Q5C509_SCHJA|nr:unknown [Schistosoma japonicum]
MQRINSAKEAVDTFERNLKTANNNTQQLINDQFNNVTQRIRSVKEAVSEFKGSLETTNENIRRLINDTFYIITQQIRSANGGVNVFERSLETIDENIRLLISKINEANPNETETLKNYASCQSQVFSEEYHNESYQNIDNLKKK